MLNPSSDLIELKITLSDNTELIIPVRQDGYVNATKLCKAGCKEYSHWKQNKNSESTIQALERYIGIPRNLIIRDINTGTNESRGTFVHRRLALILAHWISADFALQVNDWIKKNEHKLEQKEQKEQKLEKKEHKEQKTQDVVTITDKSLVLNNVHIISRASDGYINATMLCKAGGKLFGHYKSNKQTEAYLQALESVIGIPITDLVDIKQGGDVKLQGTWIHRKVAINLAQWISPIFSVQVNDWIKKNEQKLEQNEQKLEYKEHKEHKEQKEHKEHKEHKEILSQSSDIVEFKLTLKNNTELSIPVSKDGYINCTKLCKAGNKRIDNWNRLKQSEELLQAYSKLPHNRGTEKAVPHIRGTAFCRVIDGGNASLNNQGTYYPMDIAIQIAQWVNPYFALQVSRWTRELLLFGSVTLGKEKSNEELENKFQEQINNLQLQLTHSNLQLKNEQIEKQKYLTLHNQHIKKHNFHKFKKNGPCFYIIVSGLEYKDEITRIKIGICGCRKKKTSESVINIEDCSLDNRLASHRTLWPQLQVKFAVYTEHAALLESNMKLVYQAQINPNGHELIERVPIFDVIEKTKMFLNNFNGYNNDIQTYCIEENIEQYNVNTLTHIKNNILQITEVIEEKKEKIEIIKDDIKEAKEVIYEQIEVIKESEEKLVKINAEIAEYKIHLAKNIEEYKDAELKDLLSKCNMTKNGKKYEKFNRFKLHITKEIDRLIILKNQNL